MGPVEDQHVSMIAVFFKHVLMQLTNHFTLSESTECMLFSVFYSWYICNSLLGVAAIFSPIYIYSELTIKYLSHCDFVHTFLPALSIFIYLKKNWCSYFCPSHFYLQHETHLNINRILCMNSIRARHLTLCLFITQ